MARPSSVYLVCATPRSGSTLLCRALASTGVAGRPEEYFEARPATGRPPEPRDYFLHTQGIDLDDLLGTDHPAPEAPAYSSLEGVDDYRDHIASSLDRGTTPNGVFGAKIMWGHVADFAELAREQPPELFEHAFGAPPRYVWVSRRDRVRQAVSLWKAIQTQSWAAHEDRAARPPRYSFAAIDHLRRVLTAGDRSWMTWFDTHGIEPLALTYEQLAAGLPGAVRTVLEYIGVDPAHADGVEPPLERQADERSERWVEQYERESSEVTV